MPEASPRGTYLVIAEALRTGTEEGEGIDTLPSEADLMRSHGVGRNTTRRALKVLEDRTPPRRTGPLISV